MFHVEHFFEKGVRCMFDFFTEMADNTGQIVTVANYFITTVTNFATAVSQNTAMQIVIHTVNDFPSPIVGVIIPYFSVKFFDWIRGR